MNIVLLRRGLHWLESKADIYRERNAKSCGKTVKIKILGDEISHLSTLLHNSLCLYDYNQRRHFTFQLINCSNSWLHTLLNTAFHHDRNSYFVKAKNSNALIMILLLKNS